MLDRFELNAEAAAEMVKDILLKHRDDRSIHLELEWDAESTPKITVDSQTVYYIRQKSAWDNV